MLKFQPLLLVMLSCYSLIAHSDGDPLLGKEKSLLCAQCHGINGNSPEPEIPKLAGQLESYIIAATTEFQQGIRRDPMMSNMSIVVRNIKDLEDIAAYFASQPKMRGRAMESYADYESTYDEGKNLFISERCSYCHGEGGKRYSPIGEHIAPVIGGQHKEYLIKAMRDIKAGERPGDIYNLMAKILGELSDKQIEEIAEYLSKL